MNFNCYKTFIYLIFNLFFSYPFEAIFSMYLNFFNDSICFRKLFLLQLSTKIVFTDVASLIFFYTNVFFLIYIL
jgi:hypothetical protein